MKKWWTSWTTCAPPAWTNLGLLTEQVQEKMTRQRSPARRGNNQRRS